METRINTILAIRLLLLAVLVLLILCVIVLAYTPPVSKDAMVHHLAVPKLYLKHGGIYEIPFMVFSYYPMNVDLLYLIPLYFRNDIVPKYIHFAFALLTAWLIFGYVKRRTNTIYALLGVIFFLSIPIIVKLSITAYVDLGFIFFSTASLLLILRWIDVSWRLRTLILSALACGAAMGTKYNGLIVFLLLTLFVPLVYSKYAENERSNSFRAVGYGIIFASVACLMFSPWLIKNYLWTNNPIFPLYDHWFNPQNAYTEPGMSLFTFRARMYHESWWEMVLLPIRIFFQGQDESTKYFDGKLNPFLLLLPMFSFLGTGQDPLEVRREKKVMLAFAILFFGVAIFVRELRIRYIAPILPPLVILSAYGTRNLVMVFQKVPGRFLQSAGLAGLLIFIAFFLVLNGQYMASQFRLVAPFSYLNGAVSRDQYIGNYVLEYPALQYINQNLPAEAKLLFLFMGRRGYYCDRNYILGEDMFYQSVKRARSSDEILAELRNTGISHLLIRYDIFENWKADKKIFDEKELCLLDEFMLKYVKLKFYKWSFGVSQLEDLSLELEGG